MNNQPGLDPYTWIRLLMYGFTWIVGLAANFLGNLENDDKTIPLMLNGNLVSKYKRFLGAWNPMFHRIEPVIRVTYHRSGLQNILFAAENMKFIKFVY